MTVVNGEGVIACVGEPLVCYASTPGSSLLDSGCAEVSEAGAEFNVAVHLARLGNSVRFVGAVRDDSSASEGSAACLTSSVPSTRERPALGS